MNLSDEIVDKIYARWGCTARPIMDKDSAAKLLGISLGLGALFNEDKSAELAWMKTPHKTLRGTPYFAVLQGRIDEVLAVVNYERGL